MRTLPAAYVYGNYRPVHSAHHIRLRDLDLRAKCSEYVYGI